jgi:hypothetical protein
MKTIKLFGLLLMATLVFAACSKDDDETPVDVSGTKWEVTYVKVSMMGQSVEYKTLSEIEDAYLDDELEFKADKNAYQHGYLIGVWAQSGEKLTITDDEEVVMELTVSGSTLINKEGVENIMSTESHYSQIK